MMRLRVETQIADGSSSVRIAPYILAGGMSSRMGRDKAMMTLGGKTLLGRAVDTLRAVRVPMQFSRVTVVGERRLLEGADRAIVDRFPGQGPLGGMEAALADMGHEDGSGLALFMPVDMPFLTRSLLESLLTEWMAEVRKGALVCLVMVDGTPQPLLSLVHTRLLPLLEEALRGKRLKVTPVLLSACAALACSEAATIGSGRASIYETRFWSEDGSGLKRPTSADKETPPRMEDLWFMNVNDAEEFRRAETFFSLPGFLDRCSV